MSEYHHIKNGHENDLAKLNHQYNVISIIRLMVFIILVFLIYKFITHTDITYLFGVVVFIIIFSFCLRWHEKIAQKRDIKKTLITINQNEISYLNGEKPPFKDGSEYIDHHHFYTYDLDFFGHDSLYQHINRTYTYIGGTMLARLLSTKLSKNEIIDNQQAIKELSPKTDWRQLFAANAILSDDSQDHYQKLIDWSIVPVKPLSPIYTVLTYLMPSLLLGSLIWHFIYGGDIIQVASTLFTVNLLILFSQFKNIKKTIIESDQISKTISAYGNMIALIENENFGSEKMKDIQDQLIINETPASSKIATLSKLTANLESIENLMGAIIMNGLMLYHIIYLHKVLNWKRAYGKNIQSWLILIGEVERLNSLANFAYNNPDFCFPELNESLRINFYQLGHPLIRKEKRVCNDIAFDPETMIILTGSNMSGKSTFLRTLGINMVLAGIGSAVCASKANINPLSVIVSMRQTDSLTDNESYFFAEVKRLKQLIDQLTQEKCFVLLDEILKGTNSDDKQTGTIAVIKKMISKSAIGAVATHDLDVCKTTDLYPKQLMNKCFEVEIIDDELVFDYKLREGICKNKSATFLMKKMEVI